MPETLNCSSQTDSKTGEVARPLGKVVASGVSVMGAISITGRLFGFGANVGLAWLLSEDDFAVYATAIAVSGLVAIFRDGGVRELLVQRGHKEYEDLVGPVFWLALTASLIAGALLIALSSPLAAIYKAPGLVPVLVIIAISLPISTPSAILRAKLRIDMRFKSLSSIILVSSFLQYSLMLTLAWFGFGPISFVLPLLGVGVFEWIACYLATRSQPWRHGPQLDRWKWLFGHSKWLLVGSGAYMLIDRGDVLLAGLSLPKGSLGHYFMASQLALMSAYVLLSYQFHLVLLPALSSLIDEPQRRADAIVRSSRALLLIAAPVCLGLTVIADPFIRVFLHERWYPSIPVLQLFGIWYPWRCTLGLTSAIFVSSARFKQHALLLIVEGVVVAAAAGISAAIDPRPTTVVIAIGSTMIITRICACIIAFRITDTPWARALAAMMQAWFLAIGCAIVTFAFDSRFLDAQPPIIRLISLGTLFSVLYGCLVRAVLTRHLHDILSVLPNRIRPLAERVVFLKDRQ